MQIYNLQMTKELVWKPINVAYYQQRGKDGGYGNEIDETEL